MGWLGMQHGVLQWEGLMQGHILFSFVSREMQFLTEEGDWKSKLLVLHLNKTYL